MFTLESYAAIYAESHGFSFDHLTFSKCLWGDLYYDAPKLHSRTWDQTRALGFFPSATGGDDLRYIWQSVQSRKQKGKKQFASICLGSNGALVPTQNGINQSCADLSAFWVTGCNWACVGVNDMMGLSSNRRPPARKTWFPLSFSLNQKGYHQKRTFCVDLELRWFLGTLLILVEQFKWTVWYLLRIDVWPHLCGSPLERYAKRGAKRVQ